MGYVVSSHDVPDENKGFEEVNYTIQEAEREIYSVTVCLWLDHQDHYLDDKGSSLLWKLFYMCTFAYRDSLVFSLSISFSTYCERKI